MTMTRWIQDENGHRKVSEKAYRALMLKLMTAKTLPYVRPAFVECSFCAAKPGAPSLCRECLERRDLYSLVRPDTVCPVCQGTLDPECPTHGR